MTSDDIVPLPFMTVKKRFLSEAHCAVREPTGKSLPRFCEMLCQVWQQEWKWGAKCSRIISWREIAEITGLQKSWFDGKGSYMMVLIDDIPVDITEMLSIPMRLDQ